MEKRLLYNRFLVSSFVFMLLILTGAFIYHTFEGWTYFNSVYFTIITVTTIGYGDMFPVTFGGKLFTMFFPLIGIGMGLYIFTVTGKYIMHRTFHTINQSLSLTHMNIKHDKPGRPRKIGRPKSK